MKNHITLSLIPFLLCPSFSLFANEPLANKNETENIMTVTAEFEETNVLELPASVTVISEEEAQERNAQHLSDILNIAPNVNFATGASRGKFIQIRGIGERSEFQEPVNYSVGVVMDGIDLTGIGLAATTLDIQQTEILRGPQGTLYGSNGLAGLINMVSNQATNEFSGKIGITLEDFGGKGVTAVLNSGISDHSAIRLAVQNYQRDGYIKNEYLGRKDTNNIDETSARLKYQYQANDDLSLSATLFYVDVNNGYDAFSLDNNRITLSDEPGSDLQNTTAGAFQINWNLSDQYRLESTFSLADSDSSYSYDEDWTNPSICDGLACNSEDAGFDWWYQSVDRYDRKNNNKTFDVRLLSNSNSQQKTLSKKWVIGYYWKNQTVDLIRDYTFASQLFTSDFETTNTAIYGNYSYPVSNKFSITAGTRFENRTADYLDSIGENLNPDEDMWGGKLSLNYKLSKNQLWYGTLSRGYKAGGFNANSQLPRIARSYKTETQWNYETGLKGLWLDDRLTMQIATFYQDRTNIQTKQSLIRSNATGLPFSANNPCPCSFTDFTGNAASGINYGLEFQSTYRANDNFMLYANIGLLHTEYKNYLSFNHVEADTESLPPVPYDLSGRAQAHAPEHQATIGTRIFILEDLTLNLEIESKGKFYFSDRHNEKSDGYELLNLRMTYQQDDWKLHLFAHNLTDEKVQTRGFGSFPNDPRNFYSVNGPYYQFGSPRVIGLSASYLF